jgi:diacylglycerol kinase
MNEFFRYMRVKNFKHAYDGFKYAILKEHNMKVHLIVAAIVMILAMISDVSKLEFLFLLLAVALVFITELINTAIEKLVDFVQPEYHEVAKIVKDTAAGAVLLASAFALVTGILVFFDPFDRLLASVRMANELYSIQSIWIFISLLVIVYTFLRIRMTQEKQRYRPNFIVMVAFALGAYTSLMTARTSVFLLTFIMASMFAAMVYFKQEKALVSIILGAILGILLATVVALLFLYL